MKEEVRETNSGYLRRDPEARIALCKCKEMRKVYGVRMEKAQDGWNCTWAFPISADTAKREGYDATILKGSIGYTKEYNGCPYCGVKVFTVCGSCKKLNCQINTGETFTCEWCGFTGRIVDYEGDGIASGGDRG